MTKSVGLLITFLALSLLFQVLGWGQGSPRSHDQRVSGSASREGGCLLPLPFAPRAVRASPPASGQALAGAASELTGAPGGEGRRPGLRRRRGSVGFRAPDPALLRFQPRCGQFLASLRVSRAACGATSVFPTGSRGLPLPLGLRGLRVTAALGSRTVSEPELLARGRILGRTADVRRQRVTH